jgi:hypothetical protein
MASRPVELIGDATAIAARRRRGCGLAGAEPLPGASASWTARCPGALASKLKACRAELVIQPGIYDRRQAPGAATDMLDQPQN